MIEAEYLRGGLADKAAAKKYYPESSAGMEIFLSGTCMALSAEEV
ncbi:hypothetical protein [Mucilaginibacter gracilis]|nr:hypothetical protein [Mucilaginibacter gracilis]